MSTVTPKIYVKTGCPWCTAALAFLDKHHLAYQKIVVSGNPTAMEEMIALSGQSKAPTMDWDGEILADFGAAELEPFLREKGAIK